MSNNNNVQVVITEAIREIAVHGAQIITAV